VSEGIKERMRVEICEEGCDDDGSFEEVYVIKRRGAEELQMNAQTGSHSFFQFPALII
jgi:hypothetical protein